MTPQLFPRVRLYQVESRSYGAPCAIQTAFVWTETADAAEGAVAQEGHWTRRATIVRPLNGPEPVREGGA